MSTNQSNQIQDDVPFRELASDAADLSVTIETCRSSIFSLSEMMRKTEKDLSAKAVRGIADTLEMIDRNLMMADDEAENLSDRLGDIVPGDSRDNNLTIVKKASSCCGMCGEKLAADSQQRIQFYKGKVDCGSFNVCSGCWETVKNDVSAVTDVQQD